jgi:D-psicose/D-tagatose/L-ribulose 3-epimerase
MPVRFAVHAYAWTSSWSNDTLWIVDHVAKLGLEALEVPLMEPRLVDPAAILARADAAGIGLLTSLALPEGADPAAEDADERGRARTRLIEAVDLTAEMGGTVFTGVVYSAIGKRIDRRPVDADYERAAEVLAEAARHAAERGVTIGLEPINRYESYLVNTVDQALRLRELAGEPNIGVHLDTYHMNIEEDDFYAPTVSAVPHLVHVHLSESHRGIPGRGTVDWDAVFRGLADGGYDGMVGLESFVEASEAMKAATYIWRPLAPDSDTLVREGLAFLRGAAATHGLVA